ncbi:hypothetical protein [Afipia sp. GAS231]|uniref:hypothetical protein n=1 Tax=Afipia sp. GAS231 TaxID=1882747 RepID=UPI000879B6FC|nr:hypothetical protein [Afipia sp. GAS231]SDN14959.1 hypothetical protein SAMN05444050_0816 [Afipia sp. GAS231]
MTSKISSIARMGFAVLVGLILAIGVNGDAVAKTGKRHWHARGHAHSYAAGGHERVSGKPVQLVTQRPTRLEPMRYYGGPKSPMWRGSAESQASGGHGTVSGRPVQFVLRQPASLGPMRYYGGPKSPMWRGPS